MARKEKSEFEFSCTLDPRNWFEEKPIGCNGILSYVTVVIGSAFYHIVNCVMYVFECIYISNIVWSSIDVDVCVCVCVSVAKSKINFHINRMPIKYLFNIEPIDSDTLCSRFRSPEARACEVHTSVSLKINIVGLLRKNESTLKHILDLLPLCISILFSSLTHAKTMDQIFAIRDCRTWNAIRERIYPFYMSKIFHWDISKSCKK